MQHFVFLDVALFGNVPSLFLLLTAPGTAAEPTTVDGDYVTRMSLPHCGKNGACAGVIECVQPLRREAHSLGAVAARGQEGSKYRAQPPFNPEAAHSKPLLCRLDERCLQQNVLFDEAKSGPI